MGRRLLLLTFCLPLDYLIPYAAGEKKWPYPQITTLRGSSLTPLLRRAAVAYGDQEYEKRIGKLRGRRDLGMMDLLYPNPR
jgi:hypothetical protein